MKFTAALAGLFVIAASVSAETQLKHSWKRMQLTDRFWAEGATFGDLNRDGKMDVVAGPYWYEGPDFKVRHAFYPDKQTFQKKAADGKTELVRGFEGALGSNNAYSDNFFAFVYDFNGDSWPDIMVYGFPGKDATWYENPGKKYIGSNYHWVRHQILDVVDNESPTFVDVNGDGRPDILCMSGGFTGYATADWKNPEKPWTFHKISDKGGWQRFTHGLGYGDVNGDGRVDVLDASGWWEQPKSLRDDPVWEYHPEKFSNGGSQMYVYDVNGDKLNDVITAIEAHGYGLAWYEQVRATNGAISFKQHMIVGKTAADNKYGVVFSQPHAVDLIDMDGDGLKDIVTGKRFWAHGSHGDADPEAPAVLYWFKLVRGKDGSVDWVPNLIDNDSGVGTQVVAMKASNSKYPDVVVANKKGTFVHVHSAQPDKKESK
jgi:hypothetical protein